MFEKLLRENNLDHKSSRLSIRWLKSTPGIQPATKFTHKHPATLQSQHTIVASSEPKPEPGPQAVLHNRGTKPDSVQQWESHTKDQAPAQAAYSQNWNRQLQLILTDELAK
jgi:hypothetical protein